MTTTSPSTNQVNKHLWRVDITGLRAIAVLPVLLFHAFPELIPGGFVGVDIFFVISGYLISGILFRELKKTGRIDFGNFYQKRIKRILPNLFLLLFFVSVVVWFCYTTAELEFLGRNIAYSAIFAENIFLIKNLQDYFAPQAEMNPLLHVWSLAIEEQFYIFFPVFCLILWKVKNRLGLKYGLVALTATSLSYCIIASLQPIPSKALYYMPFARFWELGAGGLLAYYQTFENWSSSRFTKTSREMMSCLSAFLFLTSFALIDSKSMQFPGSITIFPILGAVLFIAAGADSRFNKLSSNRVFVFVGLVSYSLYLWHWPLIVFTKLLFTPGTGIKIFALAIAFVISIIVYYFVENPLRLKSSRCVCIWLLLGIVFFYALGRLTTIKADELPRTSSSFLNEISTAQNDFNFPGNLKKVDRRGVSYLTNDTEKEPLILFIGDSHMEHLLPRIEEANAKKIPFAWISSGGCLMALGVESAQKEYIGCTKANQNFEKILEIGTIKRVVHSQRWGNYFNNRLDGLIAQTLFYRLDGEKRNVRDGILGDVLLDQQKRLDMLNIEYVLVLDNPWEYRINKVVPEENRLKYILNPKFPEYFDLPKDDQWKLANEYVKSHLGDKVKYIELADSICPNNRCWLRYYKDDNHLRASTVREYLTVVDQVFDGL